MQSEPLDLSTKAKQVDVTMLENCESIFNPLFKMDKHFLKIYESSFSRAPYNSLRTGDMVRSVHLKNVLPCQVCMKTFDRPSLLKRHMRTHTGEKPHICQVCKKGFSTSSSLNTHRRIHTGEKPHKCSECGKCFTASSNLYYHRMTHTKNKPHKCSLCPRSFPTPGDLRAHGPAHGGAWPHTCPLCARGFAKQTNLRHHMRLHQDTAVGIFYASQRKDISTLLQSLQHLRESNA